MARRPLPLYSKLSDDGWSFKDLIRQNGPEAFENAVQLLGRKNMRNTFHGLYQCYFDYDAPAVCLEQLTLSMFWRLFGYF